MTAKQYFNYLKGLIASVGAISAVSIISERERPTNAPPTITADRQLSPKAIAAKIRVSSTAASFG